MTKVQLGLRLVIAALALGCLVVSALLAARSATPDRDTARPGDPVVLFGRTLLAVPMPSPVDTPAEVSCADAGRPGNVPDRYWLEQACGNKARPRAELAEYVKLTRDGDTVHVQFTASFRAPTGSWLVRIVRDGEVGMDQQLAAFLLGPAAADSGVRYTFDQAVLHQSPAKPSSKPTSTRIKPAATTVVVLSAHSTLPSGGFLGVQYRVAPIVEGAFRLSRRLTVDAGPGRLLGVSGPAPAVINGKHIVATPTQRDSLFIDIQAPDTAPAVSIPAANPHRAWFPNIGRLDPLVNAIVASAGFLIIIWILRTRRMILVREPVAMMRTAGLAATAVVAGGALSTVLELEYRYSDPTTPSERPVFVEIHGAEIAGVIIVGVALPLLAWRIMSAIHRFGPAADEPRPRFVPRVAAVVLAGALAVAVGGGVVVAIGTPVDWSVHPLRLLVLIILDLLAVLALLALSADWLRAARLDRRVPASFLVAIVAVLVLAVEARAAFGLRGDAAVALVAVAPLVAAGVGMLVVGELLVTTADGRIPSSRRNPAAGPWWRRRDVLAHLVVLAGAVVLVWPPRGSTLPGGRGIPLNWYAGIRSLYSLGTLLGLVVLVALVRAMAVADAVRDLQSRARWLRAMRLFGFALAVTLWSPTATWWFVPVGLVASLTLFRYFLLPWSALARARTLLGVGEQVQAACLTRAVDAVVIKKALHGKLAKAEEGSAATAGRVADEIRAQERRLRTPPPAARHIRLGFEELCFAHAAGTTAWQRAKWGALASSLAAVPWMIITLHARFAPLSNRYPPQVGEVLLGLPSAVIWWSGLGFFFGWAYPILRGRNGMEKAFAMLLSLAAPLLLVDVFPGPPSRHRFVVTVQTVGELAAVLLIMGLLADYYVLRRAGFAFGDLIELRRLSGAVTWVGSIVVAIGAAVTSIIVAGVTGALTYVGHPNAPPTTPPGSSSSAHP